MVVTDTELRALQSLQLEASLLGNQLEDLAANCCEALGLDPMADDYSSNTARSIIEAGIDPVDAVSQITIHEANRDPNAAGSESR